MRCSLFVLLTLSMACGSGARSEPPVPSEPTPASGLETHDFHKAAAGVDSPALASVLTAHWERRMQWSPVWATRLGDHRFGDQLDDTSAVAQDQRRATIREELADARSMDASSLSPADQLTLRVFTHQLEQDVAASTCSFETWRVSARSNPVVAINSLADIQPFATAADAQALLSRYRAISAWVDGWIETRRAGLAAGRVANAESVTRTLELVRAELSKPIGDWPLANPEVGEGVDPVATERVEAVQIVDDTVRPAFERWATFLENDVLPKARPAKVAGLHGLPGGPECYTALVRKFTTLEQTPEELHQIGLDQLTTIHGEFVALGGTALGVTELPAIFERLRTDPTLRFETAEQVQAKAVASLARAEAAQGRVLTTPSATKCTVEPIPAHEAPFSTIAYYRRPASDGSRPGTYFVNTHAPDTRPRFEAEVLAFHEAIPGHHLQLAATQGMDALPAFRRNTGVTVFVEGWALYSERLADELGLYSGDLDRLGVLSFDAWRAARLVVDTGIHALGWTRAEAEAFLEANTPLATNNIRNEVDRYITTPGQALAYKTGQLEIRKLRAKAEAALGASFDLRAFHDVVLGGGALPLPILAEQVDAWINGQR
jgi:uncharacterized protein (DUF885 family)